MLRVIPHFSAMPFHFDCLILLIFRHAFTLRACRAIAALPARYAYARRYDSFENNE